MESSSRRNMLAATAAGGFLTASAAAAQTVEGIPQPRRPGHGGTDPSPRNLMRDGQNPDVLVPPSIDHGSLPNLRFSFSDASMARSFDFQADDLGYVPFAIGYYIENTGTTPLRFLETFKSSHYAELSLDTWRALTPPELVQAHLQLDRRVVDAFCRNKAPIVPATFETDTGKPGSPHLRPPAVGDADKRI